MSLAYRFDKNKKKVNIFNDFNIDLIKYKYLSSQFEIFYKSKNPYCKKKAYKKYLPSLRLIFTCLVKNSKINNFNQYIDDLEKESNYELTQRDLKLIDEFISDHDENSVLNKKEIKEELKHKLEESLNQRHLDFLKNNCISRAVYLPKSKNFYYEQYRKENYKEITDYKTVFDENQFKKVTLNQVELVLDFLVHHNMILELKGKKRNYKAVSCKRALSNMLEKNDNNFDKVCSMFKDEIDDYQKYSKENHRINFKKWSANNIYELDITWKQSNEGLFRKIVLLDESCWENISITGVYDDIASLSYAKKDYLNDFGKIVFTFDDKDPNGNKHEWNDKKLKYNNKKNGKKNVLKLISKRKNIYKKELDDINNYTALKTGYNYLFNCKRVFGADYQDKGRFFSYFNRLPKKTRELILKDLGLTQEIDLKSCNFNILHLSLTGKFYKNELYEDDIYLALVSQIKDITEMAKRVDERKDIDLNYYECLKSFRFLAKRLIMLFLGNNSLASGKQSVYKTLRDFGILCPNNYDRLQIISQSKKDYRKLFKDEIIKLNEATKRRNAIIGIDEADVLNINKEYLVKNTDGTIEKMSKKELRYIKRMMKKKSMLTTFEYDYSEIFKINSMRFVDKKKSHGFTNLVKKDSKGRDIVEHFQDNSIIFDDDIYQEKKKAWDKTKKEQGLYEKFPINWIPNIKVSDIENAFDKLFEKIPSLKLFKYVNVFNYTQFVESKALNDLLTISMQNNDLVLHCHDAIFVKQEVYDKYKFIQSELVRKVSIETSDILFKIKEKHSQLLADKKGYEDINKNIEEIISETKINFKKGFDKLIKTTNKLSDDCKNEYFFFFFKKLEKDVILNSFGKENFKELFALKKQANNSLIFNPLAVSGSFFSGNSFSYFRENYLNLNKRFDKVFNNFTKSTNLSLNWFFIFNFLSSLYSTFYQLCFFNRL